MSKNKQHPSILFIGKKDDYFSRIASEYLLQHFPTALIIQSVRGEPMPDVALNWAGDYIISYLAQWIIPAAMLEKAKHGGINLHPGSPDYPGIGCTNFAIYDEAIEFGITCHYMLPKVDTGSIIRVVRFPVHEHDTVYSITQRSYGIILNVFFELIDVILGGDIPAIDPNEHWSRKPYTRKELNDLCILTQDMSQREINKRVKATTYKDKQWAHYK